MFSKQKPVATDSKEFTPVIPKGGNQQCHVAMLVELGQHEKLPRYATDKQGNPELDENGNKKILMPNKELSPRGERKDLDLKVNVYLDLLKQTHDWEGEIGVRNIRIPLVEPQRGLSVGLNYTTVAPRTPSGEYIKGQPWVLAPASKWHKLADVCFYEPEKSVKSVIFNAVKGNRLLNDVRELLGKPFNINLEVKKQDKDGKTFVNTKVKGFVPLDDDAVIREAIIAPVAVTFSDTDLLEKREDLGGASKLDLLRVADLRKIVLAVNYKDSEMQKAVIEKFGADGEKELIAKAQEAWDKTIAADKDLQEIFATLKGKEQTPTVDVEKPTKKATPVTEEEELDLPF